ncbi:MAG: hypothetical protein A2136_02350, partial [Chloroflexi bacterium RBG_16_54_11]
MAEKNTQGKPKNRWWQWAILGGLALAIIFLPFPAKASMGTERTFRVDARQFEYEPAILAVNQGDRVTIELVAGDVVHGLSIDGYDLETTADPGQPASLSFVADKAGTYRFHCTTTCGNLHPLMTG